MTDHYYTAQPSAKSHRHKWETTLKEKTFEFYSDAGVFSKDKVDFGSKLLIESVDAGSFPEGNWLDMGCGYGPIGLSLASFHPKTHVDMVDINERAIELAKENAKLNGVENVSIYPSDLFASVQGIEYAAIFTNPPIRAGKKVVHHILEESERFLKVGGCLIVVIQKKQGAPSAKDKMEAVFGNVERIGLDRGYWILISRKEAILSK